jgi:hypothetical protein
MPIALIRISRSRSPANLPNPPAHICLSCHVHPSTHHVQPIQPPQCISSIPLFSNSASPHSHRNFVKTSETINKTKENPHRKPYNPESICSTTFSPVQAAHSRQVCATVEGNLIFWISSGYEIVLTYKPPDMCQATWQWKAKMIVSPMLVWYETSRVRGLNATYARLQGCRLRSA